MSTRRRTTLVALATGCVLVGAAGGISAGQAAKSTSTTKSNSAAAADRPDAQFGGPPVHSESVVPSKDGKSFESVTSDNGTVVEVNGTEITIREGSTSTLYKNVTIDVGVDATVNRNMKTADLSDFKKGDHVHVVQTDDSISVFGGDKKHKPKRGEGRGPGGHGGPGGPGGPPPGL